MSAGRWAAAVVLAAAAAGGFWWWRHDAGPEAWLSVGRAAVRREDWAAVENARRKLEAARQPDLAHLLQGEAYQRVGEWAEALEEFARVRNQGGIRVDAAARSGKCFLELGRRADAEAAFHFVTDQRPDDVDAWRHRAAIAYDQGDMGRATEAAREVARIDPRDGRPHRLMGIIHKDLEQWEAAAADYREALGRELTAGERADARLDLAECLFERKDYEGGLRELDALDGPEAAGAVAAAVRAECLTGLGRAAEAVAALDGGLKAHPDDLRLLRLRAEAHLAADAPKEAAALLEKAAGADPYDARVRYQLALAYNRLGRGGDGAAQQRRFEAIQKDRTRRTDLTREAMQRPWDARVRRELAEVCDRLGQPKLAEMWRKAADACPPQQPAAATP